MATSLSPPLMSMESLPAEPTGRLRLRLAGLLLLATVIVYAPVTHHEFLTYDDNAYVTENPRVTSGLGWQNVLWALTAYHQGLWKPLTLMSHMLDVELFGLHPAGHLLMNLLIHAAAAVVLFLVLEGMTEALWCSAAVAVLFALHPLNVESVAWVAERKNVLSTLFWVLTLWAYLRYARRSGRTDYLWVAAGLTLGLMSKAMLVTLPFALLLLDFWPLGRLGRSDREVLRRLPRLFLEKLPLFIPVVATVVFNMLALRDRDALAGLEELPFTDRIANALVSYGLYLKKTVWPFDLAVVYPHMGADWGVAALALSLSLLGAISLLAWRRRWTSPYLLTGWLWFLGTLVPVSGVFQGGAQAMADRYAYVPLIGIFLAGAWGAGEIRENLRLSAKWPALAGVVVAVGLAVQTRQQLSYWVTTEALFKHALRVTGRNGLAHHHLGVALVREERWEEGIHHLEQALEIYPGYVQVRNNLGSAHARRGDFARAVEQYRLVLEARPESAEARANLGMVLLRSGRPREAVLELERALQIDPGRAQLHNSLGRALLANGQRERAMAQFRQAVQMEPALADAHYNLGTALLQAGRLEPAGQHLLQAIEADPDYHPAWVNLGVLLRREGRLEEAVSVLSRVVAAAPHLVEARSNLGVALAQKGDLEPAHRQLAQVLQLDPEHLGAMSNLAYVLRHLGRPEEAAAHYRQILKIDPARADIHNELGVLLLESGQTDAAVRHFREALRIRPDYQEPRRHLQSIR